MVGYRQASRSRNYLEFDNDDLNTCAQVLMGKVQVK